MAVIPDPSIAGIFIFGLSLGAITIGRAAPMLLIVLTYIALNQTPALSLFTVLIFGTGLSITLVLISSAGGLAGKKLRTALKVSGDLFDRVTGIIVILIGFYFLYLAVPGFLGSMIGI